MAQKFIITSDGIFRFGNVNMHRDLLRHDEYCLGGGFYEFDYSAAKMLLYGKSYDFGRPKWRDIQVLTIPRALAGLDIAYEDLPLSSFVPLKYS